MVAFVGLLKQRPHPSGIETLGHWDRPRSQKSRSNLTVLSDIGLPRSGQVGAVFSLSDFRP